jgi:hypothetical protein
MRLLRRSIVVLGALTLVAVAVAVAVATARAGREHDNRRAAQRDAAQLLARVVLPDSAVASATEPAGDQHDLSRPGQVPAAVNLVDRHGWWTVPEDESLVSAFVSAHQPRGAQEVTGAVGDGIGFTSESLTFQLPSVGASLGIRWLVVSMITLPGDQTGVRVDAEVQWLIPRSAGEGVPVSARALEVTVRRPGRRPTSDVLVTDRAKVGRIASLIDGLATEQPGALDCTGKADAPIVTFTFREEPAPPARVLARARQIVDASPRGGYCEPMSFAVNGRAQTPLLDGAKVIRAAQRLLGIRVPRG